MYFRKFGSGRRALLIPNAAWLARDFEGLVQDRTVVFYDPRGRGNSGPMADKTQVTLEAETKDLDLVRRHCDLDQVVLLGWSYHGTVAANYASRHPDIVERVIMSGPLAPSYAEQATAALHSRRHRGIPPRQPKRGMTSCCGATSPMAAPMPGPSRNRAGRTTNGPAM